MVGILNGYKDPRAQTLYGTPTHNYTPQEIKDFITKNSKSDNDTLGAVLSYGVDANSVSQAMKGVPGYDAASIDKFIQSKGISKEQNNIAVTPTSASLAPSVTPRNITVTPEQTSQGQLKSMLDSGSPLMEQAKTMGASYANKRGMLDSSIGATAAQDAMIRNATPFATQDAGTFYDANKSNTSNQLQAGMFNASQANNMSQFNADQGNRVGMFNTGQAVNVDQFNKNLGFQRWATQLDSDNKIALANIESMSRDSGIMGDLGKTYMSLYAQIGGDPNISPDVKASMFNNVKAQFEQLTTLLPSFKSAGSKLNFNSSSSNPTSTSLFTNSGNTGILGNTQTITQSKIPGVKSDYYMQPKQDGGYILNAGDNQIDTSAYKVTPFEANSYNSKLKNMGLKQIDSKDFVPQKFLDDMENHYKPFGSSGEYAMTWLKESFLSPVHPVGTMRTDSPLFYIWKPALSKYQ